MNAVSGSSKWILKIGLSDKEWAAIEVGNKTTVKLDAFPGQQFNGEISKNLFPLTQQVAHSRQKFKLILINNNPLLECLEQHRFALRNRPSNSACPTKRCLKPMVKKGSFL